MSGFKEFEQDLFYLVWGHEELNESIVKTWFQGLVFSEHEPTAIIQKLGGPCSVIAPIQAYLLKELLTCNHCKSNWRAPSGNVVFCSTTIEFSTIY
ncbi:hypothetical protein GJ496_007602 [Pomphorhynchus laevis]|nr:hypothetical protein GJ496_007602 [Pomphorhynchus laevis]